MRGSGKVNMNTGMICTILQEATACRSGGSPSWAIVISTEQHVEAHTSAELRAGWLVGCR